MSYSSKGNDLEEMHPFQDEVLSDFGDISEWMDLRNLVLQLVLRSIVALRDSNYGPHTRFYNFPFGSIFE